MAWISRLVGPLKTYVLFPCIFIGFACSFENFCKLEGQQPWNPVKSRTVWFKLSKKRWNYKLLSISQMFKDRNEVSLMFYNVQGSCDQRSLQKVPSWEHFFKNITSSVIGHLVISRAHISHLLINRYCFKVDRTFLAVQKSMILFYFWDVMLVHLSVKSGQTIVQ